MGNRNTNGAKSMLASGKAGSSRSLGKMLMTAIVMGGDEDEEAHTLAASVLSRFPLKLRNFRRSASLCCVSPPLQVDAEHRVLADVWPRVDVSID